MPGDGDCGYALVGEAYRYALTGKDCGYSLVAGEHVFALAGRPQA